MNARQALLAAADHIEKHPRCYLFNEASIPILKCGRGCALGWIGHFLGGFENKSYSHVASVALYVNDDTFYCRMTRLERGEAFGQLFVLGDWMNDAQLCARILRLYADQYHPALVESKPLPASVMNILSHPLPADEELV